MELQDQINIKKAVNALRPLTKGRSMKILNMLANNGQMTATEIYIRLRVEQSLTSQWLADLRRAGFVDTQRDGKFILYSLNEERFSKVVGVIEKMGEMYNTISFIERMEAGFHLKKKKQTDEQAL